jgi:hypothetical protein
MSGTLPAGIPTTARGENKDQYGNKFGKKHVEAMFKFSETHWSSDIRTTLKTLLKIDIGQKAFLKFLKAEYGKVQLEGYLEFQVSDRSHIYQRIAGFFSRMTKKTKLVQKLDNLDAEVRSAQAMVLYKNMMGSGCRGGCRKRLLDASESEFVQESLKSYCS